MNEWVPRFVVSLGLLTLSATILLRFDLTFDEGIYIEGGRRVERGDVPHRDFFTILPAGPYYFQSLVRKVPVGSEWTRARLALLIDFAIVSLSLYSLGRWVSSASAALHMTALWMLTWLAHPARLTVNHRWDSLALVCISAVLTSSPHADPQRMRGLLRFGVAGVAAGLACFFTQSMVIVVIAGIIGIFLQHQVRAALSFCAGSVAAVTITSLALHWVGAFHPFLSQTMWNLVRYKRANSISLMDALAPLRADVYSILALVPVIVAIVAACNALQSVGETARRFGTLMVFAVALLVSSVMARISLDYFWFGSTLLYPFVARTVFRSSQTRQMHFGALTLAAFIGLSGLRIAEFATRSNWWCDGHACVSLPDRSTYRALASLRSHVRPGDRVIVEPFFPLVARLLRLETTGYFLYLQPTIFSEAEERAAIGEVERTNPRWIIRIGAPLSLYRSLWPGTAVSQFPLLDSYVRLMYREKLFTADRHMYFQLLTRRDECPLP